jgi:type I restriction enzyme S subunit
MMAATKNTKALYNIQIPGDWEVKHLSYAVQIQGGYAFKSELFSNEGIPVIRISNIQENRVLIDETCYCEDDKLTAFIIHEGDMLIAMSGATTGKIGKYTFRSKAYLNQRVGRFLFNEDRIEPEYVYHYFLYPNTLKYLLLDAMGGAQPNISNDNIERIKIPLPPLPEQKAIAQLLTTADAAIHTTEKLIAQKELRKKWLMQQLLTGKKRLKGFGGEWKEMHLSDMFTERNESKYYDLPLLSIGQNGVYPQDESVKKDTSNEDKSKYKRICPGDIGYNTMRMWQGRSALSELEGIVSPAYTVVTPKKKADSLFFSYLFKMPKMTNLFWRNSQGLVDDTLNCKFKDFSIVKVVLPTTKEEQTAIAQVLQAADKEISLLKAKVEKLREQKKGLMQQLLTGKVRLKLII